MEIIGVIMETNPLHNGHLFLLNQIKKNFNPDIIIAITSTSFTMRGEISVINKFDKTRYLLQAGCNLVFELPTILAVQSGDYFASNAVNILSKIGVTRIVCGCEDVNIHNFESLYEICSQEYFKNTFKQMLEKRKSYKQAFTDTLMQLNINKKEIELYNSPNFTLAFQYFSYIKKNNLKIELSLISRNADYYQSATLIRESIKSKLDTSDYLPFPENIVDLQKAESRLMKIINYKYQILNDYYDIEGINKFIAKNADFYSNFDNFLTSLNNKKYSYSLLRRNIIYNLLNIKELKKEISYFRILGSDTLGFNYLKGLNTEIKKQIFSGYAEKTPTSDVEQIKQFELKATKLYSIITNDKNLIYNEYQLPIKKGDKNDN